MSHSAKDESKERLDYGDEEEEKAEVEAEGHLSDTQAATARTPPADVPTPPSNPSFTARCIVPFTSATLTEAELRAYLVRHQFETAALAHYLEIIEREETEPLDEKIARMEQDLAVLVAQRAASLTSQQ